MKIFLQSWSLYESAKSIVKGYSTFVWKNLIRKWGRSEKIIEKTLIIIKKDELMLK